MKRRVTLNDIARELNVTKVTVSKALRDHPDISEKTRAKVREVADRIGYKPNQIARSLTSSKTSTLGVVVPKIAHNFFAHIVDGIQQEANASGYEILLTVSEENEVLEKKHIEGLVSMQVDGLLVSVSMETRNTDIYKWIRNTQIPLVFFDRYIPGLGFNSVVIDDRNAARNGVNELFRRGCRSVAHLAGYQHVTIGKERRSGYEEALVDQGIKPDPKMIVEGGFGEDAGYGGFKELLKRGIIPDGLFTVTFPVGLGAYMAMRDLAPELMDDIKMLAFGDSGVRGAVPYPQYFVDQSAHEIGRKATELLIREINGDMHPDNHLEYVESKFLQTGWDFLNDLKPDRISHPADDGLKL